MSQVGCFVPCDKAIISVRDCIFARVGAGDCQVSCMALFSGLLDNQCFIHSIDILCKALMNILYSNILDSSYIQ